MTNTSNALPRSGLGYSFVVGEWKAPNDAAPSLVPSADAMHGALMRRADALAGCTEGTDEEAELKAIVDAIEAALTAREGPSGSGGKG